jgi:hypothetical protein
MEHAALVAANEARKSAEKAAADALAAEWNRVQSIVGPGLPLGYTRSEQRDLRATPPAGVIYTRPAYRSGKWSRKAATKEGRKLTLTEMQSLAASKGK